MKFLNRKFIHTIIISLGVTLISVLALVLNILSYPENKVYDSMMRVTAEKTAPSDEIMIILLDQESIDWGQKKFGWNWPWPRKAYADIVRYLADGGADSCAFDVMFTEPSVYGEDDDLNFSQAAEQFTGIIHTVFLSEQYGNTNDWPLGVETPIFELEGFDEENLKNTYPSLPALFPIKPLRETAGGLGNIRSTSDKDGIMRRNNLFYIVNGRPVPSLGIESLLVREGKNEKLIYDSKSKTVSFRNQLIPVDSEYKPLLRFRGELDRYIPYNAMQILQSYYNLQEGKEPLIEPENFSGKYVFFGFYAPGLFDVCATPISTLYPGVGVHITTLDNYLQDDFITKSSFLWNIGFFFIASLLGALSLIVANKLPFVRKFPLPFSLLIVVLLTGGVFATALSLFVSGLWIPSLSAASTLVFSYLISVLVDYALEGRQKKYIKSAFKQYLSPVVIDELIAHPERLKLGGERKEISIFFSDLQGFTSISEKLDPEELTAFLNDYLSAMSDVILESGGTIDKYEGDAIIAFWNAPTEQKDHPKRALEAAMKCQSVLQQMRPELSLRVNSDVYMRIGLNTGVAVVGNMGSHNRFDYTMLGDSVNLAARLEGQNKQFGTYTICTEAMKNAAEAAGTTVHFRELAKMAVVGKKEAVRIFQPLNIDEYTAMKDTLPIFEAALSLFYKGSLDKALEAFEKIRTQDCVAQAYCDKCKSLLSSNLDDWSLGVWVATMK
ncbi:MAG: adenylate/guanylate cyclase domain-containing protein [Treponema sp.]|jgi:adenylate cyclase|nr:adenylate/guanylate cyclase domain-containing protein [Treponema sp.]